jgi:hypothetical protein
LVLGDSGDESPHYEPPCYLELLGAAAARDQMTSEVL